MAKVYTKTGDKGMTTLFGGSKIRKTSPRVNAYGAIDEANAFIGVAAVYMQNDDLESLLRICQSKLFIIGAEIASDERGKKLLKEKITQKDIKQLETLIDVFQEKIPEKFQFQIPGNTVRSAHLHVARTQVRKAERFVIGIKDDARVSQEVLVYLNRLSDFLFVLSRIVDETKLF